MSSNVFTDEDWAKHNHLVDKMAKLRRLIGRVERFLLERRELLAEVQDTLEEGFNDLYEEYHLRLLREHYDQLEDEDAALGVPDIPF